MVRNERGLITGNPAMARKDGATVDLALYDDDPGYRAQIDAKIAQQPTQDYLDGLADGRADKDPDSERLAYGWNRMNDYEKGYVAAGLPPEPGHARQ